MQTASSAPALILWDGKPESLPEHIRQLGPIPPAWKDVRFSPDPKSDLYLLACDAKGRSQYVYSPEHVHAAQEQKFRRVRAYRGHIARIRSYLHQIDDPDTRDCLLLIFEMGLRPGSQRETYADKEARGATTLRGENVVTRSTGTCLEFTGKDGVFQSHPVRKTTLRENITDRAARAGTDGLLYAGTSDTHLRRALEPLGLHPKDLRTILACSMAERLLRSEPPAGDAAGFTKVRNAVADAVSAQLGNTRAVALSSYIDPLLFEEWDPEGEQIWSARAEKRRAKSASMQTAFEKESVSRLARAANENIARHNASPSSPTDAARVAYDAAYGYGTSDMVSPDPVSS